MGGGRAGAVCGAGAWRSSTCSGWSTGTRRGRRLIGRPRRRRDRPRGEGLRRRRLQPGRLDRPGGRAQGAVHDGRQAPRRPVHERERRADGPHVELASPRTSPGDQGLLTPTNNRDVVVADFNNDGWLDFATAVTISDGDPKHISHPRIYMNQGAPGGNWQGFRFEAAATPQLFVLHGERPARPRVPCRRAASARSRRATSTTTATRTCTSATTTAAPAPPASRPARTSTTASGSTTARASSRTPTVRA